MDGEPSFVEFAFPGPLRDCLVNAVRRGDKTATSSLLREYEVTGEPLPCVGDRGHVLNSAGKPIFVIETMSVELVPLGEVSWEHVRAEGEGHESVAAWKASHMAFWSSSDVRDEIGWDYHVDDESAVVLETFRPIDPPSGLVP